MGCTDFPGDAPRGFSPLRAAADHVRRVGLPEAIDIARQALDAAEARRRPPEFKRPTRAELARVDVRAFLAAWERAEAGDLPPVLAKIILDGVEFEITVDHLRALVGDEFGPRSK